MKKEWRETPSVDGKEIALRAMGRIQDLALLPDYLDFLFHEVATQDKHTGKLQILEHMVSCSSIFSKK